MKSESIVLFLLSMNLLLFLGANCLDEKSINNSIDGYDTEDARPKSPKSAGNGLDLAGMRPVEKMAEMLSRSGTKPIEISVAREDNNPIEEGNRKILKFGERVIESIRKNGIASKDARLLKSRKYEIDWWRKDRRLERIRKRLSEELERKPELKNRLRSLGWRNASELIHRRKKVHTDRLVVVKPSHDTDNDSKKTLLYKTMKMTFKHLRNGALTRDKETREPAIFVYMPITVVASPSEIDLLKEAAVTESPESDSPTKFSLNTFEGPDLNEIVSDTSVIDVAGSDSWSSTDELASTSSRTTGQVYDSDRLLQLIPLVVEELRNDLVSEDERRTFVWIFGKRLWQLIEREASKRHGETMDPDLALFLLKGELADRDADNGRRRRQRRDVSNIHVETINRHLAIFPHKSTLKSDLVTERQQREVSIVARDGKARNRDYENGNDNESNDRSSGNSNDGRRYEPSFVELIELAVKPESNKLAKKASQRVTIEKPMKKKFMDYDYDDHSFEVENNYY